MKTINLTKGKSTIVDDEDYDYVNQFSWHYHNQGYAVRKYNNHGKRQTLFLHRLLMKPKDGKEIDHINGDRLDNRRSNLREVTHTQNLMNRTKLNSNNKSGHRGISWSNTHNRWVAKVNINGKRKCVGYFRNLDIAIKAHEHYLNENWGIT